MITLTKEYIQKHIKRNYIDTTKRFELIFCYGKITSIEKDAFKDCNNLKRLYLHNNKITSIEKDAFKDCNNLTELYLNDNQITSIKKGDFDGLHNLNGLYLPCNQISSIEQGAFDGLNNLKWLNLSSNPITSIEKKYYESRKEILKLINDLKNNNLSQTMGQDCDTINHSIPLEKSSKIFEEIAKIRQNRPALHGSARDNLKKIAALWSAYLDTEVTIQDVGFMMAMLKAARHKNGDKNNMDNFFDGTNYIALAGEAMWYSLFNPI